MSTVLPVHSAASADIAPTEASRQLDTETLRTAGRTRWRPPRATTRLLGVVLVVVAWQIASSTGALASDVIGSPHAVLDTARHLIANGELGSAIGVSLQRIAWGVVIGLVVGISLALVSGLSRIGADVVDAPVQMLRTIPFAGIIPLLIVWLGVGESPKVVLIALATTFPIYINLSGGIRSVDPGLLEAGRTVGLSRAGLIVHVVLPSALPQFLIGLRLALGISWLALVFAEQISAVNGLGGSHMKSCRLSSCPCRPCSAAAPACTACSGNAQTGCGGQPDRLHVPGRSR